MFGPIRRYGTTHIAFQIGGAVKLAPGLPNWTEEKVGRNRFLQRWLHDPGPDDVIVASLRRELMRALGYPAWEPTE